MKIFIHHVVGEKNFIVEVEPSDTVKTLKSRIKKVTAISSSEQGLVYNRSWLEDNRRINEYGIKEHQTVLLAPAGCLVEASYQRELERGSTSSGAGAAAATKSRDLQIPPQRNSQTRASSSKRGSPSPNKRNSLTKRDFQGMQEL